MRKKQIKLLSACLSALMLLTTIPVSADFEITTDANGNSDEYVEYQSTDEEDFSNQTSVFAQIGSEYKVTIPKVIVLSGIEKKANYYAKVSGDIAGYETITVTPDESVTLTSNNKASQIATISQDKTTWKFDNFNVDANGLIKADELTAGKWSGIFYFNIGLKNSSIKVTAFDKNGNNLKASASEITGEQKDMLMDKLNASGIANSRNVNALIEVESEKFNDLAATTFDVSNIASDGDKIAILHFNETTNEWELINIDTVHDGKVSGDFTSFSPVAFVSVENLEYVANGFSGTYDGNEHSISVESNGNISYSLDNIEFSGVNPVFVEAGTYTVYYKIEKRYCESITGSKQVIIDKANSELTKAPTAKILTYIGSAQELVNAGVATNGTIWYKVNDSSYATTIPTATNAGTYTVYYKVVGNNNYNDVAEQSIKVFIGEMAGIYDENDNLIKSWDELVALGLNVGKNYTYNNYRTSNSGSGFNIIVVNNLSGKLVIPNSITNIGDFVFYDCRNLTSITIPNSVTSVGASAFRECTKLTSITIPNSVTSIGNSVFSSCKKLTSITYRGVTYTDKTTFNNKVKSDGVATGNVWP